MEDFALKRGDLSAELIKSWHPQKNGDLSPSQFSRMSNKKVWWMCEQGHEWQATIANRAGVNRTGCPYCAGRKPTPAYNLAAIYPDLNNEWHFEKNDPAKPDDFSPYSHKKVWWHCHKGHEWQTSIAYRTKQKSGCPYCAGRLPSDDNCLFGLFPDIAKEWHPTKNGQLTPKAVTPGSDRKIWWICSKGHSWRAIIYDRTKKHHTGCPYCAGKLAAADNNLGFRFPALLREWHYEKNKPLTPDRLTPGSNRKVWWKCANDHEWKISPNKRTSRDATSCPYCAGNAKRNIQDFRTLIERRGGKLLSETINGAHKPLRVRCHLGHEFKISFPNARAGKWCPYCSVSLGERICRHAFETLFKEKFPISHPAWLRNPATRKPLQLDGYCKDLRLAFEHQGIQHDEPSEMFGGSDAHRSLRERDKIKADKCKDSGSGLSLDLLAKRRSEFCFWLSISSRGKFLRLDFLYDRVL
jgi:hypothetical protein